MTHFCMDCYIILLQPVHFFQLSLRRPVYVSNCLFGQMYDDIVSKVGGWR